MQPATRFGPYEVVAQIGSGEMEVVYLDRDTRLRSTRWQPWEDQQGSRYRKLGRVGKEKEQ